MKFLEFLEQIRTPFGDVFFSLATRFGEESIFIVIGLVILWCVNKWHGYYLFAVGAASLVSNQFLKMVFRVPRPWVRNPEFSVVGDLREVDSGYSFPSGHTQISSGIYGGIARISRNKAVRISCVILCVLVAFSRMYLGMHTPWDVLTSLGISFILIFGIYPFAKKAKEKPVCLDVIYGLITAGCIAHILFVTYYQFPLDIDTANHQSALQNGYKFLGALLGIWLSYRVDIKYLRYETSAVWWGQIVKFVIGIMIVLFLKESLKQPLSALFHGRFVAGAVRYFAMVAFAGCIWPITFRIYPQGNYMKRF